jgi:2-polyprenyl-6-hydroxyphenyl methylase/3-demethylubiquinone-9 3-methyltransferase
MSLPNKLASEVEQFSEHASRWWDPAGPLKTLHDINPLRMGFIESQLSLHHKKIVDIGCGGGILSEALAKKGAIITGIDASAAVIEAAKNHAKNLDIQYEGILIEDFAPKHLNAFDAAVCMELLEHVPSPETMVKDVASLVKPGGLVFFSTLSRNPKSYVEAILVAEYVLKLVPKGTHHYGKFIKPSELNAMAESAGLTLRAMKGIGYHVGDRRYFLRDDVSVNYLACFEMKETP